jgi:hypothetical protein
MCGDVMNLNNMIDLDKPRTTPAYPACCSRGDAAAAAAYYC